MEILYVEDSLGDVRLLRAAFLNIDCTATLAVAEDGVIALEKLEQCEPGELPHLILLDLNIPKKNGYEVLKELKRDPRWKKIPVMVFTGSQNSQEQEKYLSFQDVECFSKPTDLDGLIELASKLKTRLSSQ